jgi:hypothetical protein
MIQDVVEIVHSLSLFVSLWQRPFGIVTVVKIAIETSKKIGLESTIISVTTTGAT